MRKQKSIELDDGRTVTIKEIKVFQVVKVLSSEGEDWGAKFEKLLPMTTADITVEELGDLYPSEQEEIWKAFEEVNSVFFNKVRAVGLDGKIKEALQIMADEFLRNYAVLLKQGMAQQQETMGIATS